MTVVGPDSNSIGSLWEPGPMCGRTGSGSGSRTGSAGGAVSSDTDITPHRTGGAAILPVDTTPRPGFAPISRVGVEVKVGGRRGALLGQCADVTAVGVKGRDR